MTLLLDLVAVRECGQRAQSTGRDDGAERGWEWRDADVRDVTQQFAGPGDSSLVRYTAGCARSQLGKVFEAVTHIKQSLQAVDVLGSGSGPWYFCM